MWVVVEALPGGLGQVSHEAGAAGKFALAEWRDGEPQPVRWGLSLSEKTATMMLFIGILMAVGWYFGGSNLDYRQVLAVTTNLRNVGLTYVLVDGCCVDADFTTAVLAFMALMVPANLALTVVCGVVRKRRSSP